MSAASVEIFENQSLRISGELNSATVPAVLAEVEPLLDKVGNPVHIELAGVTRSDSAGVALLVELMRLLRQRGKQCQFKNLPAQMQEMAKISGLAAMLALD